MVLQEILVSAFCVATSNVKNCMRDIISVRDNDRGGAGFKSQCTVDGSHQQPWPLSLKA